ncbi:MAG: hypothetical protein Q8922_13675 [Bacteroidota bacterium]|nr:hypothetical protein [Bacteroidota bacterium]MDP4234610.1 hypothetical protein [Bacteroidota bacterium]MDP4243791.1 hypothetical protein [Bacteroidota bacterium]MDP4288971.1 hypothetical protein [Bacteroidota bacterium]
MRISANSAIMLFIALFWVGQIHAQSTADIGASTTPRIHYQFPFQTMWDDAVLRSAKSGKPTAAFDLDLIDSASIRLANTIIHDRRLQIYLRNHFEPAMNDFAVDPPPTVGLDSLRNLGWRLSGLEKDYKIAKRPCIIVIGTDKQEIDRIVFPDKLSARELEQKLDDILHGRNTVQSIVAKYWSNPGNLALHWKLIDLFEERSKYDSVVRHLDMIRLNAAHPVDARKAWIREADLRLHVEGAVEPVQALMATLAKRGPDSVLHYELLHEVLAYYKQRKKFDSVAVTYDQIMALMGTRDPDLINEEAWYLASTSSQSARALGLINEALAARPDESNFLDTRALVEGNLEKFDDAIRDEEQALKFAEKADKNYFETQLQHYRDLKEKAHAELDEDTTHTTH